MNGFPVASVPEPPYKSGLSSGICVGSYVGIPVLVNRLACLDSTGRNYRTFVHSATRGHPSVVHKTMNRRELG